MKTSMSIRDKKWGMKSNIPLAKQLARREIPSLVCDAVNLDGVAMTLAECHLAN